MWKHHEEDPTFDRNTFYNDYTNSSVEVVLNDLPSSIKNFHTLNYEGSQSKVEKFISAAEGTLSLPYQPTTTYTDQSHYNLSDKLGWYVGDIVTDQETGYISEFLEKEGKWFNYIIGDVDTNVFDISDYVTPSEFSVQGIGFPLLIGEGFEQSQATLEIEVEPPTINPQTNEADVDTVELEFVENTVNYQIPQYNDNTVPMYDWGFISNDRGKLGCIWNSLS